MSTRTETTVGKHRSPSSKLLSRRNIFIGTYIRLFISIDNRSRRFTNVGEKKEVRGGGKDFILNRWRLRLDIIYRGYK